MQQEIQKDSNTFSIFPNILHVDADVDKDVNAGGIVIALQH